MGVQGGGKDLVGEPGTECEGDPNLIGSRFEDGGSMEKNQERDPRVGKKIFLGGEKKKRGSWATSMGGENGGRLGPGVEKKVVIETVSTIKREKN